MMLFLIPLAIAFYIVVFSAREFSSLRIVERNTEKGSDLHEITKLAAEGFRLVALWAGLLGGLILAQEAML